MASAGNIVTPDRLGRRVDITVWICFVLSGLAVLAKVLTKLGRTQRHIRLSSLQLDDYLVLAALVFAAGQSISVSRQVAAGLGDHISDLSTSRIEAYEKARFAGQILYICGLATAKTAALLFAHNLQPHSKYKALIYAMIGLSSLWAVVCVLGIAFQCKIPNTWAISSTKCLSQPAFWTFVEAINGLTDFLLVALFCAIVRVLQISKAKIMLLSVFAARSLVIVPIVFRVLYIFETNQDSGSTGWDPTYRETNVAIATAVLMNASLVISCIPFLKPLMEHLQPGWSTSDVIRGVGYNVMYGKGTVMSGQYPMGSVISGQSRRNGSATRPGEGNQSLDSLNRTESLLQGSIGNKQGISELKIAAIKRTDVFHVESYQNSPRNSSGHSPSF